MLRWRMLVGGMILGGACMPMQTNTPPREVTSVNASFGHTYDATLAVLQRRKIPLDTTDRGRGIVTTGVVTVPGVEAASWADCGTNGLGQTIHADAGVYRVEITGDSISSTVRVYATWTSTLFGGRSCETGDVWERIAEGEIRRQAEISAGPPARPKPATGP